jgi:hypothetical protein
MMIMRMMKMMMMVMMMMMLMMIIMMLMMMMMLMIGKCRVFGSYRLYLLVTKLLSTKYSTQTVLSLCTYIVCPHDLMI